MHRVVSHPCALRNSVFVLVVDPVRGGGVPQRKLQLLCWICQCVLYVGPGLFDPTCDVCPCRVAADEGPFASHGMPCDYSETPLLCCLPCIYSSWCLLHIAGKRRTFTKHWLQRSQKIWKYRFYSLLFKNILHN